MDGVVEIITGRERRRHWSDEAKLRIVAETYEPGARVRTVAVRHGVSGISRLVAEEAANAQHSSLP